MKGGKVPTPCAVCGIEFLVFACRVGVRKTCSEVCDSVNKARLGRAKALKQFSDPAAREAASRRTAATWMNKDMRDRHEAAVRKPAYRQLRSQIAEVTAGRPEIKAAKSKWLNGPVFKAAMRARPIHPPIRWRMYGGVKMRSGWEVTFATHLDQLGLRWSYEPTSFELSDGRAYTPDFWVETPLGNCFVEVHRMIAVKPGDEGKIQKIALAVKELPQPLIVIDDSHMLAIAKLVRKRERAIENGNEPPEMST